MADGTRPWLNAIWLPDAAKVYREQNGPMECMMVEGEYVKCT